MPKKNPSTLTITNNIRKTQKLFQTSDPTIWERRGEKAALRLFKQASTRVPAYVDFLKKHRVNPESIRTIGDFKNLPLVSKKNYLKAYPHEALSWNGNLLKSYQTYASTSGSTGEPFYFPRGSKQTDRYAFLAELYLRAQFKIHERSTLYVNCFAMGSWIGGLFTYQAIECVAQNGSYALHQVTPGLAKEETLRAIETLGKNFDQVIIGGYPPFVKDLLDEGIQRGMSWKDYAIKFVFSAEGFSETFRDYVSHIVSQENILLGSLNHYGTVDLGTMAYETPIAHLLRRLAVSDKSFFEKLFNKARRLPTLAQFVPEHFYFENVGENLVCTADAGFPLIRYDLKDQGGVCSFDEVVTKTEASFSNFSKRVRDAGIASTVFKLPFVYLYERSDFSVVLYGANIYPEHIRHALETESCRNFATGKCVLRIVENASHEPRLEVHVELRVGKKPDTSMKKAIEKSVVASLCMLNSEFRSNYTHLPKKMKPIITLWSSGDSKYFPGKGKHKWVIK